MMYIIKDVNNIDKYVVYYYKSNGKVIKEFLSLIKSYIF